MTQIDREQRPTDSRPSRLCLAFGTPAWSWLRTRLRRALTNGKSLPGVCSLGDPRAAEWDAANALLGRPASRPGKTLRVPTADLEARLVRAGLCNSLREALEIIDGPIRSLPEEAERDNAMWGGLVAEYHSEIARWHSRLAERRPDLSALVRSLSQLRSCSVPFDRAALRSLCQRDAGSARQLLDDLTCVFDVLAGATPADIPRSQLAASALGDSHALDTDKLLFRAIARLAQQTDVSPREVWKCYRVLPDEVSSSVLVLNLRFSGNRLAEAVNGFAETGEPCRLLLRHCNQLAPHLPQDTRVYVCENPTVLEAAAIDIGAACPPLICTEGQPSFACQKLLIACGRQPIQLYYHGDFDWGGIRIANYVQRIVPTIKPWRYQTNDYERLDNGRPLGGTPVEADWDPQLRPAMTTKGQAYHEEQLLVDLLADLRGSILASRPMGLAEGE